MSSHAIPKSVERFWIQLFRAFKRRETFFIIIAFWVLKGSVHFEAKFKAGNSQIITTLRALNHNKKDNRAVVNYTLLCCLGLELQKSRKSASKCVQHFLLVVFILPLENELCFKEILLSRLQNNSFDICRRVCTLVCQRIAHYYPSSRIECCCQKIVLKCCCSPSGEEVLMTSLPCLLHLLLLWLELFDFYVYRILKFLSSRPDQSSLEKISDFGSIISRSILQYTN